MKLNNKGYLLVEIIVAFSLAIAFMYIITEITISVKNKNDDLKVSMLATADQTIIYNMIMSDVYAGNSFDCGNVEIVDKKISYKGKTNIVNDYVTLDKSECSITNKKIKLKVNNFPEGTFDVVIP